MYHTTVFLDVSRKVSEENAEDPTDNYKGGKKTQFSLLI